MNAHQGIKVNT